MVYYLIHRWRGMHLTLPYCVRIHFGVPSALTCQTFCVTSKEFPRSLFIGAWQSEPNQQNQKSCGATHQQHLKKHCDLLCHQRAILALPPSKDICKHG